MAGPFGILGQIPRDPGVLGATPNAAAPAPRSFLDKLLGIYESTDPSKREDLRRQGLIQGGLAIMAASGQGASTGEALLAGFQHGTGATAAEQQRLKGEAFQSRMGEIAATNPAALPAMLNEALAAGRVEEANAISAAIRATSDSAQGSQAATRPQVLSPGQQLVSPTGEILAEGPDKEESGFTLSPGQIRILPDGTIIRGEPKPATTAEREAATQYGSMAPSVENVEKLWPRVVEEGGFNWIDLARYRYSGPGASAIRGTLSDDKQAFMQASETLATQVARALFGARVTEQQRDAVYRTYIIAPGDKPTNVQQTIASLKRLVEDISAEAGGEVQARERARVEANLQDQPVSEQFDTNALQTGRVAPPVEVMPEFQ